ncbi:MAG: hypothetical protein JAY60_18585 [Candidatus Thiodiazotropha weberae]|nr:hypothetical protein [Candidatus Thiodiazotropha weberae]
MNKAELIEFMQEAERRGDMEAAKAALVKIESLKSPAPVIDPPKQSKPILEQVKNRGADWLKNDAMSVLLPGVDLFARSYMKGDKTMPSKKGEFDPRLMAENVPSAANNLKQGLLYAAQNPKEVAEATYNLGKGTIHLGIDGYDPSEEYPKQVWEDTKERYGGVDNILKTIQEDPVGFGLDASVAGKGLTAASRLAKRSGAGLLSPDTPVRMMSDSLNWSNVKDGFKKRDRVSKAILEHDLPLGRTGVETARHIVNEFEAKSKALIAQANKDGTKVPANTLYDSLWKIIDDSKKTSGGAKVRRDVFKQWIEDLKEDFGHGKASLTPEEVLHFKRKLYERINFEADHPSGTPTSKLINENLAGRAKYTLDQVVPGFKDLNKEYGPFLDMMDTLERNALRLDNNAPVGLGARMNVMAGTGVGGIGGAGVAGLLSVLEHPSVKSYLARSIYRNQNPKVGLLGSPGSTGILGLLQTGRLEDLLEEESK